MTFRATIIYWISICAFLATYSSLQFSSSRFGGNSHRYLVSPRRIRPLLSSPATSSTKSAPVVPECDRIVVCTNSYCQAKGSDATMATFTFLTPPTVPVVSIKCLGRCNKGPNVRIESKNGTIVESSMVRSVEKVIELLQTHLHLDVNMTSAEVLRLNYEGNINLRNGEVDSAIDCYDKALALGDQSQEGVLLVMRGTALLQRAYACRLRYKETMSIAESLLPSFDLLQALLQPLLASGDVIVNMKLALSLLTMSASASKKLESLSRWSEFKSRIMNDQQNSPPPTTGEELLQRASWALSLYEFSLLRALQDLLTSTVLLPGFAQAWRRAGDALAEFRLFHSAVEYYEVALRLDTTLTELLLPVIERYRMLNLLASNAEEQGWSTEAILALVDDL